MKKRTFGTNLKYWAGRSLLLAGCFGAVAVFAQSPATSTLSAAPDLSGISGFCLNLAQQHPWIATVFLIIGALRVLFKPLMSLLDAFVKENCDPDDYERLQSFESGSTYKWICFALDLLGSIKLPVVKAVKNNSR